MPKINDISTVSLPKLSDKLVGTSVGGTPDNQTYNFTLQQLKDLFGGSSTITLTTTGSSGAATLVGSTLNIPNYTLSGLGGVPLGRQLTINGTAYDLSADRSWNVGTVTSVSSLTLGTSGTDLTSSVATGTTTPVITLNVPTASATNRGVLSSADWTTFNSKGSGTVTSVSALTIGLVGTDITSSVATGTTTPVITLNIPTASAANRGALSAADWSTFNTKVGGVTASSPLASSGGQTPNITIQQASGGQNGYLSSTDWTTFNNKQASGNYITSLTGEATASGPGAAAVTLNNASVTGKVLTGLNVTGGSVSASDSILTGFGKLQNQINGLIGGSIYQGTWNASTNTPALASGVGTKGYYYIVSVAGTTNLDGITDWNIGDWAIFDGTAWQQVDNTDAVVSVNGQTGAVSLTTDNIPEGTTNLYYLDSRARAALSFTAGSGAYNSTTGVITIPTNTSQLTNGAAFITLGSLSGTGPIGYNNTTGAISIAQSGTATNGYLSSTDWNTFNNKGSGTLSSVGVSMPSAFSVTSSPLTSNGTIAITGAGLTTEYIDGTGALQTFPTITSSPMVAGTGTCSTIRDGVSNDALGNYSFAGGGKNNTASGIYSTISGGYTNSAQACFSVVGGGTGNVASARFSTIAGGANNAAAGWCSFIGGGLANSASDNGVTIAGGRNNSACGTHSAIVGGYTNTIGGSSESFIGGGNNNTICNIADWSVISGGYSNTICEFGLYSTISGGKGNTVSSCYSFIGGGFNNATAAYSGVFGCNLTNNVACSFMANNFVQPNLNNGGAGGCAVCADANGMLVPYTAGGGGGGGPMVAGSGGCSIVGNGSGNTADSLFGASLSGQNNVICASSGCSFIGGGFGNTISGYGTSVIVGGTSNTASGAYSSVVVGGNTNTASGTHSFVGGGQTNTASGGCSSIIGGSANTAIAEFSFIGGGNGNSASGVYYSSVVGGCANLACGNFSTIGGGIGNSITSCYSTIGGGCCNSISISNLSGIFSGFFNSVSGYNSSIVGGCNNVISANRSFIGGGVNNIMDGDVTSSVIVGGVCNTICGDNIVNDSTISGGRANFISRGCATIGGGCGNCATRCFATISGGGGNTASGAYSFIGGGRGNINGGSRSFIGAGTSNSVYGINSAIVAGNGGFPRPNCITGSNSFIGAAAGAYISSNCAGTISGYYNTIEHDYSYIIGTSLTSSATCTTYTNALSKASGTFRINHPDPSKTATKYLQHSFVESPTRGDNIYRFSVTTCNCNASISLPDYYKFLNEDDQVWVSPKNHFGNAYGIIDSCQTCVGITSNCDGEYNVLVIGTRKDIDAKNGFLGVEIWK